MIRHRAPLIITAVGHRPDVAAAVHSYGGVIFHDAINMKHAMKAADHPRSECRPALQADDS